MANINPHDPVAVLDPMHPDWLAGFREGKNGKECSNSANLNWLDGYITGDAEKDLDIPKVTVSVTKPLLDIYGSCEVTY